MFLLCPDFQFREIVLEHCERAFRAWYSYDCFTSVALSRLLSFFCQQCETVVLLRVHCCAS